MRTSEQIQAEIEDKFGFVPPFFGLALQNPQVLENLWQQTLYAYVNNPLSPLFKEKLSASLSRYCAVSYCMICHSCSLRALGVRAREVLELLESPHPTETDIDEHLRVLTLAPSGLKILPESNSVLEKSLLYCSIFIATEQNSSEYCRSELRRILGPSTYAHLVAFIAYVKTCHVWIEAHPEVAYEADKRVQDNLGVLLEEEPGLADFFQNYVERVRRERQSWAERMAEITECKRSEAALQQVNEERRRSQEMLQLVMDLIPQSIWWKDRDSRFLGCNRNFAQMTGVGTPENIIGKTDYDVWTKSEADFFRSVDARVMVQNQAEYRIVEPARQRDGTLVWLETNKIPLHDEEGRVIGTLGTAQDITDRKQAEEQIKASLQQKEILLKEVHHRVKNNLQVIDSLFRHQCRHTKDKQTTEILKECQNRVNSMALLHEKLYQSKDLSKIDFAAYIQSLVANLFDSYSLNANVTTLKINVDDIFLDIETALPCGLIVNELVSNSLKYAFPAGKTGEIHINFHSDNAHNFLLSVKDNGVGLPSDFDFHNLQSLGLKLVRSLVRQLRGAIEINPSGGTEFMITFTGLKNDDIN